MFFVGWEVRRYETVTEVLRAEGSIFMASIAVFHPIERETTFIFFSSLYLRSILLPALPKEFYKHKCVTIIPDSASKYRLLDALCMFTLEYVISLN